MKMESLRERCLFVPPLCYRRLLQAVLYLIYFTQVSSQFLEQPGDRVLISDVGEKVVVPCILNQTYDLMTWQMTINNYQMIISPHKYTVYDWHKEKYSLLKSVDASDKDKVVEFSLVIHSWSPSDPAVFVNIAGPGTFSSSLSDIIPSKYAALTDHANTPDDVKLNRKDITRELKWLKFTQCFLLALVIVIVLVMLGIFICHRKKTGQNTKERATSAATRCREENTEKTITKLPIDSSVSTVEETSLLTSSCVDNLPR